MSDQFESDLTPLPEGSRWITGEIGQAELQKSAMAVETFEALRAGETNVERIRNTIREKRKLLVSASTGEWTKTASDRFVNEHAWVLARMNKLGMIPRVSARTKSTSLLPGADQKLPMVIDFFRSNEPFEWKPGPYGKAPGW
jgi:hypothetical protein